MLDVREWKGKNRRRASARAHASFRVDYADQRGLAWTGIVRNISLNGLFMGFVPKTSVSTGESLTCAFTLPNGHPFKLTAEVVRVTAAGCAVKFMDLSQRYEAEYTRHLDAYCSA